MEHHSWNYSTRSGYDPRYPPYSNTTMDKYINRRNPIVPLPHNGILDSSLAPKKISGEKTHYKRSLRTRETSRLYGNFIFFQSKYHIPFSVSPLPRRSSSYLDRVVLLDKS